MAKVITYSIQKGGTGKSTTAGITAYLMAEEGYKVLVVDMDSQGNVTDLLTQVDPKEIEGKTVFEAIEEEDAKPFIIKATDNIDVLPSDDFLAMLPKWMYTVYKGNTSITKHLKKALESVKGDYDFILIDTPPSLGEYVTNSICASDYIVILGESSKWAYTAIDRFMDTVEHAKQNCNPDVEVIGVLRTMTDGRRSDSKEYVNKIAEKYQDLAFNSIIKRKATAGRLSEHGIYLNKELAPATKDYKKYYKELKERMGV